LFLGSNSELTEQIIGAFYYLYNLFRNGLPEVVYHRAMKVELGFRQIPFKSEVAFPLFHRGVNIGNYRADLIVDSKIIVECKAVEKITPVHIAQLRTYLTATELSTGLLLNFGPEPDVRRVDR
jgi:GxxExxY protein